jgi:hypothetical protein
MSNQQRTLEERIKFDHGLKIGTHLANFTVGEHSRRAMVRVSPRGLVHYLAKPNPGDMYSAWDRLRGDKSIPDGGVIVWGARNPEIMQMFEGEPAATIPVK